MESRLKDLAAQLEAHVIGRREFLRKAAVIKGPRSHANWPVAAEMSVPGSLTIKGPYAALTVRVIARARGDRSPLWKGPRGTQAAIATPAMQNVSDAFQPSE